jgi:hypothetical protein
MPMGTSAVPMRTQAVRNTFRGKRDLLARVAKAEAVLVAATERSDSDPGNTDAHNATVRAVTELAAARTELELATPRLRRSELERKAPLDAEGYDLRPDPLAARTPAELIAALRLYRIWAGEPPSARSRAGDAPA